MKPSRTLHPEDTISRYRVVGPLGAGGMGEVYLARDQSLERNVALKILPPELVANEDRVRRFMLEARSASSLSHPNIVTIYEIGQDVVRSADGSSGPDTAPVQFISMELVSGQTLGALIDDSHTDLRTLVGYLAQAAEGLAKAHAAGIVHRDLKPGNIMVTADGFAKVLDFGLAKLTERRDTDPDLTSLPTRAEEVTGAGAILGTTAYMSPEQVQGRAVDHRSDIFSFGCVVYEAATRKRPFAAESAVETMHRILHDKPAPIEEANPKAPAELRRLVRRCLAKSPEQRLQSMKDIALELREIADEWDALSPSGTSTGSGSGVTAGPLVAPGRSVSPIAIGAVLVAVVAVLVAVWSLRRGTAEPAAQAFQTMRLTPQTSRGNVTEAALSLDGRYLAYLTGDVGRSSVRVQQVATGSDVEVVPSEDGLFEGLSFSPDGNYLFYLKRHRDATGYRALMQVPSLGGLSRERAFDVDSRVSFAPDGKRAVFYRFVPNERRSDIVILDLEAGKERVLVSIASPAAVNSAPDWSPDGRRIAVIEMITASSGISSTLALYDADSARREVLHESPGGFHQSLAWLPDGTGLVRAGFDLGTSLSSQISLVSYPDGKAHRITNDQNEYQNVSSSAGDGAIAAVRSTRLGNIWLADPAGAEPRALTRVTSAENSPFGVTIAENGSIAYSAPRDQSIQVWVMPPGGGEARSITPPNEVAVNARSHRHGVAYDRYVESGAFQVWGADLDGGRLRALTPEGQTQLRDVARDGSVMIWGRQDAEGSVWIGPLGGGTPRQLGTRIGQASIAPDGSRILLGRNRPGPDGLNRTHYEVVPTAGGAALASFSLPARATSTEWTPDSSAVSFLDGADPAWNVYRYVLPEGPIEKVTDFAEGRCSGFEWSPDGRRLAVERRIGDVTNVWVTGSDGSKPVQITRFPEGDVFSLRWTPDSRAVVLDAGRVGSDAVLIRDFR